ncbi:MAG: hypothetical protein IPN88_16775 [Bacteroidetes bacterium]|nr:hypothetical protein [Bacteroidota bacterium]
MARNKIIKKTNSQVNKSTISKPRRVSTGDVIKGKSPAQIQTKTIEVRHEAKLEKEVAAMKILSESQAVKKVFE